MQNDERNKLFFASLPFIIHHSLFVVHHLFPGGILLSWYFHKPYVSAAQRKAKARREVEKLKKKGQELLPVQVEGLKMGKTFWGKAWCQHIESFSDFDTRLPRGKTYVRNESILDLQIRQGMITAMVMGSELYSIRVRITPLTPGQWKSIKKKTSGQINSLVELLQGKLSDAVMQSVIGDKDGLFPKAGQIDMDCSCEDAAEMCKHLAAVLYGVGCRLDEQPELLFKLRGVDHTELLTEATRAANVSSDAGNRKVIAAGDLSDVFGIDIDSSIPETVEVPDLLENSEKAKKPRVAQMQADDDGE
jgi:uncharacterized Zn finger protein